MTGGVFAAMLTPLKAGGAIDEAGLCRLAFWLLGQGCDGVVLFGTTGEFPSFSLEERNAALDRLIEDGVPAAKLIVGTGCPAVRDTHCRQPPCRLARLRRRAGGAALLF